MSMFAFFPWFSVDRVKTFDRIRLVPHETGKPNQHGVPESIDPVVSVYRTMPKVPVRQLAVLQIDGRPFDSDLSEDERQEVFDLAEALAMSALSTRQFFTDRQYANRDTFTAFVQGVAPKAGGILINSRRRDGTSSAYWSGDTFMALRPAHVQSHHPLVFDDALVEALMNARAHVQAKRFEDSVFSFNRANTDSDQATEQSEVVQTVAAFEALFPKASGKAHTMAEAVCESLATVQEDTSLVLSTRLKKVSGSKAFLTARDFWVRDIYYSRNSFAHGSKTRTLTPATWSPKEHLLLGAFVYPLCLKIELERAGLYKTTDDDRRSIFTLDHLLRADDLFASADDAADDDEGDPYYPGDPIWTVITNKCLSEWLRRTVVAELKALAATST